MKAQNVSQDLVRRAEAIRARFVVLEGVKGSGWHDDDRNPTKPDIWMAPQKNGRPKCSTNAVYFDDEFTVVFAGPDVERLLTAFQHHYDALVATGWGNLNIDQHRVAKRIPTFKASAADDGTPLLVIQRPLWNLVLQVLELESIGVSGAPIVPDGTTP